MRRPSIGGARAKDRREFIVGAVKLNKYACKYAAPELGADRTFVFKAVKKNAYARKHAAPKLMVGRGFIPEV